MKQKANYGIDAPNVIRNLLFIGMLCIVTSIAIFSFVDKPKMILLALTGWVLIVGISLVVTAIMMILSSKIGKIRERERILDMVNIKGDEHILDVGCGKGLYLIGAAKRLMNGKAVGIDIWQSEDLSGNSMENTIQNAKSEGVDDKVYIETADMRKIPFENSSFDIVLSSFAIHNIYDSLERKKALLEIIRVLKPGGKLCIIDFQHIDEYMNVFKENGITGISRFKTKLIFPPATVIIGIKAK
ncbi:MAG: class I SAM-dependent methyltransferase [Anoxybacillus sp.]|nr:methyltransferase domain-containing protein [Anoxybacillus sp.]MCL6588044.1 class I SAM-dependent methyltransferase [Anoxybacillus sp.]